MASSLDWTSLPSELMHLILEKLILLQDYIRFSAVCKQWSSIGQDRKSERKKISPFNQPPMLLVYKENTRCLYNIMEKKTYVNFSLTYDKAILGSSFGWLVMHAKNFALNLTNPFSGKTIELPLISMPGYNVSKLILSDDPSSNPTNYIVAAICKVGSDVAYTVAFMRYSDKSWTHFNKETLLFVDDILFCKNQLYAVNHHNYKLTKINIDKNCDVEIPIPRCYNECEFHCYLLESVDKDLLLVRRFYGYKGDNKRYTKTFEVRKLVEGKDLVEWIEIKSIGNQTLFLGENSMSISTDDFFPYIERNSIYYTDNSFDGERGAVNRYDDMGIFNLGGQCWYPYYGVDEHIFPAIWISPALQ